MDDCAEIPDSNISCTQQQSPFKYNPIDKQWQDNACSLVGVPFEGYCNVVHGGPHVPLKKTCLLKRIEPDGNCLFRCFSYINTGSECHHMAVCSAIKYGPHHVDGNLSDCDGLSSAMYITNEMNVH